MVSPVSLATQGRVFKKFWNTVKIRNAEQPIGLAQAIKSIMYTAPEAKLYFRTETKPTLEMQPSILSLLEYITNPEIQIHASRNYPKDALMAIKKCLRAKRTNQALQISDEYVKAWESKLC